MDLLLLSPTPFNTEITLPLRSQQCEMRRLLDILDIIACHGRVHEVPVRHWEPDEGAEECQQIIALHCDISTSYRESIEHDWA